MNTTISPRETGGFLSEKQIEQYLQISGLKDKLSENDTRRFIAFTQEFNLNPFKREIHCLFDDTGKTRQFISSLDMKSISNERSDPDFWMVGPSNWKESMTT